jgi:hypothetical protein
MHRKKNMYYPILIATILVAGSVIAVFILLFRITYLSGYQKGIAKGRDICLKAFEGKTNGPRSAGYYL